MQWEADADLERGRLLAEVQHMSEKATSCAVVRMGDTRWRVAACYERKLVAVWDVTGPGAGEDGPW